jgi:two-component system, LuxR family, response regulator FixJ
MMEANDTVFVVDDDGAVRESLGRLMQSIGLAVETFPDALRFLERYDPSRPGCLVLDLAMPGLDGLELQEQLIQRGIHIPVLIISAHGDVEKAVRAMKSGAFDFIKKPCKGEVLLERIRQALALDAQRRQTEAERSTVAALVGQLTPREREVMDALVDGKSPKQIAHEFGLSRKTVDVHRAHIMAKLNADSLIDLVRMAQALRASGPTLVREERPGS